MTRTPLTKGPRGWRNRWQRVPPEQRRAAAAALTDVAAPSRGDRILAAMLAISLLVHFVSIPIALRALSDKTAFGTMAKNQQAYLHRVMEKDRAKGLAPELAQRVTMPPPPDNPQEFVSKTMGESLVQEIEKVVAPLLDVKASEAITRKVGSTLSNELRVAVEKMSSAKLSEKEIKELQEKFRVRAQTVAMEALKEHRIDTQVERAAVSTTEWYEKQVSPQLFGILFREMYGRPSWDPGPRLWYTTWGGGGDTPRWGSLDSLQTLFHSLRDLERVKTGNLGSRLVDEKTRRTETIVHEAWPGPNEAQARYLKQELFPIYNRHQGGYKNQSLLPGWDDFMNGSPMAGYGVVAELYPHRAAEMQKRTERIDQLWAQTFAQVDAYLRLAESGADEARLKAAQQACFQSMDQIKENTEKLYPVRLEGGISAINNALLNDLLRDRARQDRLYKLWNTSMDNTLEGLIRRYAEGQFAAGIIKNDGSAEEALKRFPEQILPLVDRDVRRLLPRDKFGTLIFYPFRHHSPITDEGCPPSDAQCAADRKAMDEAIRQFPELKAYAEKRRALLEQYVQNAVENTVQRIRKYVFTKGLLTGAANGFADGVDYTDDVEEKLDARKAAWEGRGQDYARLTKEGVPDTAAPLVALVYGLGKGNLLEPVSSPQVPSYASSQRPQFAWRASMPRKPARPAKWGFETQYTNACPFKDSPGFEGIPFAARFPALDGDLGDWGSIRPLVLRPGRDSRMTQPILLYAAWNYQGFMFGYKVQRPAAEFFYPEQYRTVATHAYDGFTGGVQSQRNTGTDWLCQGDHLRLLFDTLDARAATRGEPHTQEFVVLPQGSDNDPTIPGFERIFSSRRKATETQWRKVEPEGKIYLGQPPPEYGPDGTGPYRVMKLNDKGPLEEQGYTVEVLIPRSLFKVPVFCPGWYIGFDCAVATGVQRPRFNGQTWLPYSDAVMGANAPKNWGDLLLLGTDPYIVVQDADETGTVSESMIPGHSYLITVIDPDRNVHLTDKDTVLVSAETDDARPDMEVFILEETEANSGVFRGYLNTQPGRGREVQGVLEIMPGQTVRLGYVDIGNAKGQRNVVSEMKLPVISPCMEIGAVKKQALQGTKP